MAPSVTVPNAIASPIQMVTRVGRAGLRRFSAAGRAGSAALWSCGSRPPRAPSTRTTSSAVAAPKWTGRAGESAVTPEASSAANSEPALNVACILAIVVRW